MSGGHITRSFIVDLTIDSILHLATLAGQNHHCDHVNVHLRIIQPSAQAADTVPLALLRQRASPILTDSQAHYHADSSLKDIPPQYKTEYLEPYRWKYRFVETSTKRYISPVFGAAFDARVSEDLPYPFIDSANQHPTPEYTTSRYADVPPLTSEADEYVAHVEASYPNATCTACGDGATVELWLDSKLSISQHLEMGNVMSRDIVLPRSRSSSRLDLRVAAGDSSWFEYVFAASRWNISLISRTLSWVSVRVNVRRRRRKQR